MRPIYHALSSAGVAAIVYRLSGSGMAAGASFATGVLIDADHLVDYFRVRGLHFDWQDFMGSSYFADAGKIIVPLHSVELLGVLWLLSSRLDRAATLGVATSFCLHLLLDRLANPLHPLAYSLIFRWLHRFEHSAIVRGEVWGVCQLGEGLSLSP